MSKLMQTGQKVFIRTVTHYHTGEVVEVNRELRLLCLRNACWVADTGRFANALKDGTLSEVEPFPGDGYVEINMDSIVDLAPWSHPLPRVQK